MDSKWIFVEHRYMVNGRCVAAGIAKIVLLDSNNQSQDPRNLLPNASDAPKYAAGQGMLDMEPLYGRDN